MQRCAETQAVPSDGYIQERQENGGHPYVKVEKMEEKRSKTEQKNVQKAMKRRENL